MSFHLLNYNKGRQQCSYRICMGRNIKCAGWFRLGSICHSKHNHDAHCKIVHSFNFPSLYLQQGRIRSPCRPPSPSSTCAITLSMLLFQFFFPPDPKYKVDKEAAWWSNYTNQMPKVTNARSQSDYKLAKHRLPKLSSFHLHRKFLE